MDSSVTTALQNIIRERLSGVDWLLAINGAWVVRSSASYNPCQGAPFSLLEIPGNKHISHFFLFVGLI